MRVVISIDECKPHWAVKRGLDKLAASLGMRNIRVLGDFDSKLTDIFGDVDNFEEFETAMQCTALNEGSLFRVAESPRVSIPRRILAKQPKDEEN